MPGGFGHYISVIGGALEVIYGHLSKWLVKMDKKFILVQNLVSLVIQEPAQDLTYTMKCIEMVNLLTLLSG